jgi:hypothetical protein
MLTNIAIDVTETREAQAYFSRYGPLEGRFILHFCGGGVEVHVSAEADVARKVLRELAEAVAELDERQQPIPARLLAAIKEQ